MLLHEILNMIENNVKIILIDTDKSKKEYNSKSSIESHLLDCNCNVTSFDKNLVTINCAIKFEITFFELLPELKHLDHRFVENYTFDKNVLSIKFKSNEDVVNNQSEWHTIPAPELKGYYQINKNGDVRHIKKQSKYISVQTNSKGIQYYLLSVNGKTRCYLKSDLLDNTFKNQKLCIMTTRKNIWNKITDFPNYEINRNGMIRTKSGKKILSPVVVDGNIKYNLKNNEKSSTVTLSHLFDVVFGEGFTDLNYYICIADTSPLLKLVHDSSD